MRTRCHSLLLKKATFSGFRDVPRFEKRQCEGSLGARLRRVTVNKATFCGILQYVAVEEPCTWQTA